MAEPTGPDRRHPRHLLRVVVPILLGALTVPVGSAPAAELRSYAIVQEDATLRIRGETVRLFGVLVPDDDRQCRRNLRPARCGLNRAAIALEFQIQGFVRCDIAAVYRDGTLGGQCFTDYSPFSEGIDLGAYLIEEGLAVATPGAPFRYQVLENIARSNGRGIWGFTVDAIGRRP